MMIVSVDAHAYTTALLTERRDGAACPSIAARRHYELDIKDTGWRISSQGLQLGSMDFRGVEHDRRRVFEGGSRTSVGLMSRMRCSSSRTYIAGTGLRLSS